MIPGKILTLKYEMANNGQSFPLEESAVVGSVAVFVDDKPCTAFSHEPGRLVLKENECPLSAARLVRAEFSQRVPRVRFPLPVEARSLDRAGFVVIFEGRPVSAFHFEGDVLVLDEDLGAEGNIAVSWRAASSSAPN